MQIRILLLLAAFFTSPVSADHQRTAAFLKSFAGVWDVTEGSGVSGTLTFVTGCTGQTLYVHGEIGSNKFDDFVAFDPKTKAWLVVGVGNDGSRYTHSVNSFPEKKMSRGQKWSAETIGVTAGGQPTTGALQFVAKSSQSYEMIITETVSGEAMPDRIMVATRRQAKDETELSKSWREFLTGSWARETKGQTSGKADDSRIKWKCVASGDALLSYGTSGDQGYGTLMYWDKKLGTLVEQGHSSEGQWKIAFELKDQTKSTGIISGRLADGRTGSGTILVERTGEDSYTATVEMDLSDGSTMKSTDKNVRQ